MIAYDDLVAALASWRARKGMSASTAYAPSSAPLRPVPVPAPIRAAPAPRPAPAVPPPPEPPERPEQIETVDDIVDLSEDSGVYESLDDLAAVEEEALEPPPLAPGPPAYSGHSLSDLTDENALEPPEYGEDDAGGDLHVGGSPDEETQVSRDEVPPPPDPWRRRPGKG